MQGPVSDPAKQVKMIGTTARLHENRALTSGFQLMCDCDELAPRGWLVSVDCQDVDIDLNTERAAAGGSLGNRCRSPQVIFSIDVPNGYVPAVPDRMG
jgi:hypothetical protein